MTRQSETPLQNIIRLETQRALPDLRLFRIQCGSFELVDGRWITVGVPGMADTQGWLSRVVTPEMVGRRVAIYASIEVKRKGARTQAQRLTKQIAFARAVNAAGGLAGFASSVEEALSILNRPVGVPQYPHE